MSYKNLSCWYLYRNGHDGIISFKLDKKRNKVEFRYNAVKYNMVLLRSFIAASEAKYQRLNPQKTPHYIPRTDWRAMGCLSWIHWPHYNGTVLHMPFKNHMTEVHTVWYIKSNQKNMIIIMACFHDVIGFGSCVTYLNGSNDIWRRTCT